MEEEIEKNKVEREVFEGQEGWDVIYNQKVALCLWVF